MEPVEFLGGKFKQATQILPGAWQTFRAIHSASGREVFLHRIPAGDPAAGELAFLLASALTQSEKARSLVVEVVEATDGFVYIATATQRECLLLRRWLQSELDEAGGHPAGAPAGSSAPATPAGAGGSSALEDTDPQIPTPPEAKPQPAANPAAAKQEPGEFTRIFMAGTAAAQREAPPALDKSSLDKPATPPAPKPKAEPGEFTRFFQAAPPPERKPAAEPGRTGERPSNPDLARTSFVQRPNTPLSPPPAPPPKSTEPGEFTRLFMQAGSAPGPSAPLPSPSAAAGTPRDPFAPAAGGMFSESKPVAPEPAAKPMGEYTRIFGSGGEAPPVQKPSSVAAAPPPITDDPLLGSPGPVQPVPPGAPPPSSPARGPSEYTLVMSGFSQAATNAPPPHAASGGTPPGAGGPGSIPLPKAQVNVTPPNLMQGLHVPPPPSAHAGAGGLSASSPLGSASANVGGPHIPAAAPPPMHFQSPAAIKIPPPPSPSAAPAPQKKNNLVIFFIVMGVLAVALVILIVLLSRK